MLKLNRLTATRITSTTAALESLAETLGADTVVMRIAPDEYLFIPELAQPEAILEFDPYAIILQDSSWFGGELAADESADLLEIHCEWEPPTERPVFAQGAVAEIPLKMWFTTEKTLFVLHAPYAHDFEERVS